MLYEIGMTATRTMHCTDEKIRQFADVSGDENPIHLDDDYAATTQFGKRIVQGMLTASLFSAILANDLPGYGTVYLGQNLKFTKPVFIGDTITATVTITKIREGRNIITFDTICTNQDGETVIKGDATVLAP
jgi:acyl dehydratase